MFFWTAEPMTAQGPRKGESSLCSMRNGFRNPTRASSPRQLPTDHVHAVSTREYQSDQSSRLLLRCYRPCCPNNKTSSRPTSRHVFPPEPPVECLPSARTVLTVKDSLRRAKQRRALDCCAPFRPTFFATGGSGGNTKRSAKNKTRQPTCEGLTRSLHLRTTTPSRTASNDCRRL